MRAHWLWDSRLSLEEAKEILKDKDHIKFDLCAENLLAREGNLKEVFKLLDKKIFCQKWPVLKKRMKRDAWNQTRVTFLQMIYEHLYKEFRKQGVRLREWSEEKIPAERKEIADQIKAIRQSLGYTQKEFAQKMGSIQQYISRLETGRENFSIDTLEQVAKCLNKKLVVSLK